MRPQLLFLLERGVVGEGVSRSAGVRVREIGTLEGLESLRPSWNALLLQSPEPVVYLTYEWLSTWWRCFRTPRRELCVLAVTADDDLIGIAPMVRTRARVLGVPYAKIEFLSMMRYALSPTNVSASLDFIVKAGRHREVVRAVLHHLAARAGWNFLRLHPLPSGSPSVTALEEEAASRGYRFRKRRAFVNSIIPLEGTWEAYFAEHGKSLKRNIKSRERNLEKMGVLRYSEINKIGELENGFRSIMDIERRSWKFRMGIHLDAPVYRHFYRELLEVASACGWLKLGILELGGRRIAYDLSLAYNRVIEGLKTSYDESLARFAPGNIVIYRELESLFQSGFKKKNILWGDLAAKAKFTSIVEPHEEIFLYRDDLFARLLHFMSHTLLLYRATRYLSNQMQRLYWKL